MTALQLLILFAIAMAMGAWLGRVWFGARATWQRVEIGDRSRGPNADAIYRRVEISGREYLFTYEQADEAEQRALKYRDRTRPLTGAGGFTTLEVVAVVAILGAVGWFGLPKLFHGSTRRANNAAQATAKVEQATVAQGSSAAASVVKIAEANAAAPDSPSKTYIAQEAPVALSKLPAPDPQELIEAERRRAAVFEGKYELARKLFTEAMDRATELQRELDQAKEARARADQALLSAAAAERARTMQAGAAGLVCLLLAALWVWSRLNGFSLAKIAEIRASVFSGKETLEQAIDRLASPRQQNAIRRDVATRIDLPTNPPASQPTA